MRKTLGFNDPQGCFGQGYMEACMCAPAGRSSSRMKFINGVSSLTSMRSHSSSGDIYLPIFACTVSKLKLGCEA